MSRRERERGEIVAHTLVLVVAVLLTIGFSLDAARYLTTMRALDDAAASAARAGAQHLDEASVLTGGTDIDPTEGPNAALDYLDPLGLDGTATVAGDELTVTATTTWKPTMFAGFGARQISVTATARAVRGVFDADT